MRQRVDKTAISVVTRSFTARSAKIGEHHQPVCRATLGHNQPPDLSTLSKIGREVTIGKVRSAELLRAFALSRDHSRRANQHLLRGNESLIYRAYSDFPLTSAHQKIKPRESSLNEGSDRFTGLVEVRAPAPSRNISFKVPPLWNSPAGHMMIKPASRLRCTSAFSAKPLNAIASVGSFVGEPHNWCPSHRKPYHGARHRPSLFNRPPVFYTARVATCARA